MHTLAGHRHQRAGRGSVAEIRPELDRALPERARLRPFHEREHVRDVAGCEARDLAGVVRLADRGRRDHLQRVHPEGVSQPDGTVTADGRNSTAAPPGPTSPPSASHASAPGSSGSAENVATSVRYRRAGPVPSEKRVCGPVKACHTGLSSGSIWEMVSW